MMIIWLNSNTKRDKLDALVSVLVCLKLQRTVLVYLKHLAKLDILHWIWNSSFFRLGSFTLTKENRVNLRSGVVCFLFILKTKSPSSSCYAILAKAEKPTELQRILNFKDQTADYSNFSQTSELKKVYLFYNPSEFKSCYPLNSSRSREEPKINHKTFKGTVHI